MPNWERRLPSCWAMVLLLAAVETGCQTIRPPMPAANDQVRQLEALGARVETEDGKIVGVYFFHSRRPVTDKDLAMIIACPHLREVWLHGAQVTDAGLVSLSACRHLKRVEIPIESRISDLAVEQLRRLLPNCQIERIGTGQIGTTSNDS